MEKKNIEYKVDAPKWFMNIFMPLCTIAAAGIAIYFAKNKDNFDLREIKSNYEEVNPIGDLNKDKFPELKIKYLNGSIDTLYSEINQNKIFYKK